MNPALKRVIVPLVVVVVLAGALFAWYHAWSPWKQTDMGGGKEIAQPGKPSSVIAVDDFDAFQKNLAQRVSEKFGVDPASVVVAPAAYDLGWLLDAAQTYPADRTDCVPTPMPAAIAAPHLFPSYRLASNTAASMTLGSDALQQLTSASLDVSHQASLVYSIEQVQVVLMDLKTVDQISGGGACGDYVSQHPKTRLIRGLVLGKISFSFSTDNPISAQAKLPKLGGISAKGDPNNSTVTVADDQPSQILEMVSILQPVSVVASTGGPGPGIEHRHSATHPANGSTAVQVTAPVTVPPGTLHIFLQQDASADPAAAKVVATKLQQSWPMATVEPRVERIPTSKMPSTAQIRFFNAGDQQVANTCRDYLKASTGIDARVVRIGLAAPAGQLEIWLQKAGGG